MAEFGILKIIIINTEGHSLMVILDFVYDWRKQNATKNCCFWRDSFSISMMTDSVFWLCLSMYCFLLMYYSYMMWILFFAHMCRWVLLPCVHDYTDYIYFIYCMCVYAPVFGCAPEPRHPAACLQMGGRDGWRLSRGVWASSSGHLITAPAPAACLCLPQPLCLGASFLPESDDAHGLSPKCRSLEGPTLAQSTVVSD